MTTAAKPVRRVAMLGAEEVAPLRIRLGYAAIALDVPRGSPNRTLREATLEELRDDEARRYHLRQLAARNLKTTLRILRYNVHEGIPLYRLTSRLVPFATHPRWRWDWEAELEQSLAPVRDWVRRHRLRLSSHLEHFVVLNSEDAQVRRASAGEAALQARVLGVLGAEDPVLVTHLGSGAGGRERALERFRAAVGALDADTRGVLVVENDDTAFTAADALEAAAAVGCPAVFDWHHHRVNPAGDDAAAWLARCLDSWGDDRRPKLHLSSPAAERRPKAHADDVRLRDFLDLCEALRRDGRDCDVMLEAKDKDRALKRLTDQLRERPGFTVRSAGVVDLD